jgi:predicted nucleotidyltransferase
MAMVAPTINIPRDALAQFCRRHGIRRLSLFGSVLRDDFRPGSDIDVLVEFKPERIVGWEIIDIEDELSQILGGHKVDMVNPKYLIPRLKDRILSSAQVQYDEG